ncbi:AfsR/SARP family transcriptional regulator [Streptomyces sp. 8L]|uniref:AfsR/SARP family transcriptional regulator n=1 Tax=Streptomyces sp. 8L TaxID=2877242 RepID=UPI001CD693DF|nr:BTAD domain-containing putative transcriptional regulator [Streptomyces sp. 8L]MCA1222719.1 AfsR/SARP family transcriptional regulator [Streptomyces sp. 8L]
MRFGVLGPLTVWDDEGDAVRVPEAKVRGLLADLLAHDGKPVSEDRLVEDLWGEEPPGKPLGALQAKVSQLRRALGRDRVVRQAPGYRLRLDPAADEVDADRFDALMSQARLPADPRARAALLTEALDLWRGPAYADFADEEFVRATAARLAEQRLVAMEEQAEARIETGDHVLLVGELTGLVARHPLREGLRALQMRALYLAGRQSEALVSYEDLRGRLAEDLGVDPGPALASLHRAMLRQDPGLERTSRTAPPGRNGPATGIAPAGARATSQEPAGAEGPAATGGTHRPAPASPPHSNLLAPLTPLVGRAEALARLSQLLSTQRLVTLTGPGGVGKTRLALAAAGTTGAGRAPDGVWLVEFSGARGGTTADLSQAVAAVLGIRDDAPSAPPGTAAAHAPSLAHRLADVLRDRTALLVLDNCEHVVDAAADLAELLLRTAPGLRVLVTSQEPLGLTGESVFLVEPLETDDAVKLFTERAAASAPGFPADPETFEPGDRAAVAEICRRLDGIPLALELAATRVRALGVGELAARLGDRFRLLTAGRRGAPARHQTLRAMIDWSWELLGAPERIVLRRLAAHTDGCDLAAAEAVCAGEGVARDEVLDLVTRLVDRSLVIVVEGPAGRRYRLLESVAAYATERLHEMQDIAAVRDRHLRHYLALAERVEPGLRRAEQRDRLARLDADAGNLRAALDEALRRAATGRHSEAVRLATALCWWWLLRGRLTEGRRELSRVLAAVPEADVLELVLLRAGFALLTGERADVGAASATGAGPDQVRRARALWLCAYGLFSAGEVAAAAELNATVLGLFDGAQESWGIAAALGLRASLALVGGGLDAVGRDGQCSARIFRELGDQWGELQAVSPLAVLAEIKGDYAEAARLQHEGLRMARELGLEAEVSARLSGLGRLALLAGDWEQGRELHERARRIAAEQGYKYGEIHSEMGLALGARRSGDLDRAERHLLHIRDGHADVSSEAGDHLLRAELGFVAELRGHVADALRHQLSGLDVARSLDEPRALALSLEGIAGASVLKGDTASARRAALLLGAADAARRGVGAPLPPSERGDVDRVAAATTAILGEAAFTIAFRQGTELAVEEALHHTAAASGEGRRS